MVAVRATYVVFTAAGFVLASWASRIPQIRTHLRLDPSRLGLLLVTIAVGAVLALPMSGPLVTRVGPRRAVAGSSAMAALGLGGVAAGYQLGSGVLAAGLFVLGFASGVWDVAMNIHAAAVERRVGRSIMSRFHAAFSLGAVAGAAVGIVMVAAAVPVLVHLIVVSGLVLTVAPIATRGFLPADLPAPAAGTSTARARSPWREPRTVLIGLVTLAFAFAEGTGNDWIGISVIDHRHAAAAVGTMTFAGFLVAMTVGRWWGPDLLDRWGRVPVLRVTASLAIGGLVLFVAGPGLPAAIIGALLWGAGTSLGFPVGMSAGADDPARAPGRVGVVATIGYCAFLGGPPLIGILGDHITVTRALLVVAAALVLAATAAWATDPSATRRRQSRGAEPATDARFDTALGRGAASR